MTTMLKQLTANDCFLACLGMATGKTPEEYAEIIHRDGLLDKVVQAGGIANHTELYEEALAAFGMQDGVHINSVYTAHIGADYVRQLLWKRPAMLCLCSLNFRNGYHSVYWDGEELYDPSNMQVYKFIENIGYFHEVDLIKV